MLANHIHDKLKTKTILIQNQNFFIYLFKEDNILYPNLIKFKDYLFSNPVEVG
jgi:hypothetical protein